MVLCTCIHKDVANTKALLYAMYLCTVCTLIEQLLEPNIGCCSLHMYMYQCTLYKVYVHPLCIHLGLVRKRTQEPRCHRSWKGWSNEVHWGRHMIYMQGVYTVHATICCVKPLKIYGRCGTYVSLKFTYYFDSQIFSSLKNVYAKLVLRLFTFIN